MGLKVTNQRIENVTATVTRKSASVEISTQWTIRENSAFLNGADTICKMSRRLGIVPAHGRKYKVDADFEPGGYMGRLTLQLLGPPEVRRADIPLHFRSRKELALLLYLVSEGGRHTREKLVELFWPRSGESRGRANLRNALSSLRKTLSDVESPDEPYIVVERHYVSLDSTSNVYLDLREMEAAESFASPNPEELAAEDRRRMLAGLRNGLEAYRGDFLEGFYLNDAPEFDHWADVQRESWRRRVSTVYDNLSALQVEGGEFQTAIETATRWVASDPTRETAYQRLIEAHSAAGDHQEAIDIYEAYRSKLERELGATPGPEIETLAVRLKSGLEEHRPAPRHQFRTTGEPLSLRVPLVGRSEEFSALVAEYYAARESGPRGVAVIGEAGIGKTRLVNEFLSWAEAQGADVLRGQAFENGGLPYGPILNAFRERIERENAPDDLLNDLWLSELSRLLPEIRDRYPDLPPPTGDAAMSRSQLYEAVYQLVSALSANTKPEPVVMFFDDLQWADKASLELRQYLWQRTAQEQVPVLIITSVREEALDFDPEVYGRLVEAQRHISLKRIPLEPLRPEDIAELFSALTNGVSTSGEAASPDHDEFGSWLYRETGGQPFFLMETLEDLLDRGVLAPQLRTDGEHAIAVRIPDTETLEGVVPAGIRDTVRGRLSRLSNLAMDLLAAGAVLGQGFSFELLFRVAKLNEDEGLATLDEVISNRLLREAGAGEGSIPITPPLGIYPTDSESGYVFSHAKIREVVYTEAGEARRRVLHRRAMEALEEKGAPAAELVHHALSAGLSGQAFYHSLAAGDEAMVLFAIEDAAGHYERARTLYEEARNGQGLLMEEDQSSASKLYERLGHCYGLLQRWGEAREAYEQTLNEARAAEDREAEWTALSSLAMLGTDYTTQPEYDDQLLRNIQHGTGDEAESETPQAFVWLPEYARDCAEQALSLARELGHDDLIANSLYAAALLGGWSGRWDQVAERTAEARSLYVALGDRALEAEMLTLSAWGEVMEGRPQEALRFGRTHLDIVHELNDPAISLSDAHGLVLALLETGEYEESLALARQAVQAARSLGASERLQPALVVLGDAHKALFQLEEARAVYCEMGDLVVFPEYRAVFHSKLCALAAMEEDWEEAHARALDARRVRGEITLQFTDPFHRHYEIEALLRGGDSAAAREELDLFSKRAAGHPRLHVAYLRARSVLDRYTGEMADAVEHLREAEMLADSIGLPGELWQIRSTLGELLDEHGDLEAAHLFFQAAESIQTIAGKIEDERLRSHFLGSNTIRRVIEKSTAR